jgi:hypothetical protein
MHKFLVFVFSTAFVFGSIQPAFSAVAVKDSTVRSNTGTIATNTANTVSELQKFQELANESWKQMTEQLSLVNTANSTQQNVVANGQTVEAGIKVQQAAKTDITVNNMGTAEGLCSYASTGRGIGPAYGRAHAFFKEEMVRRGKEANKETGTTFENGLVDGLRKMFNEASTLCSPAGNKGANAAFCSGDGSSKHLQIASVLYDRSIMPDDFPKINYLEKLLTTTRTHVAVDPNLLANANTEAQNLFVLSDRLQAEMSMLDAVFGKIKANNFNMGAESAAIPYLEETLKEGDFTEDDLLNELLSPDRKSASYMGQLEALVRGMMNPTYYRQKASGGEGAWRPAMLYQLILSNHLQLEQIKLLEAVALATSTTVVVNREDALEELNGRISAINVRQ